MAVGSAACWISIMVFFISYLIVPFGIWWIKLFIRANGFSEKWNQVELETQEEYEVNTEHYDMTWAAAFSNQ